MKLKLIGQELSIIDGDTIAEGSVEFATFSIECDSSWDGYSKTVTFRHASAVDSYSVAGVIPGRNYYIPSEVLSRGTVYLGVIGVFGAEHIATTNMAGFTVSGAFAEGKTPGVTPDAYAQYVNLVESKSDEVRSKLNECNIVKGECDEVLGIILEKANEITRMESSVTQKANSVSTAKNMAESYLGVMNGLCEDVEEAKEDLIGQHSTIESAEAKRASAETVRAGAETARQTNEATRVASETARATNELTRQSNELARVSAELIRDTKVSEMESEISTFNAAVNSKAGAFVLSDSGKGSIDILGSEKGGLESLVIHGNTSKSENADENGGKPLTSAGANGSLTVINANKNYLTLPYDFTTVNSKQGVTFKVVENGGIEVTGATTSVKSSQELYDRAVMYKKGKYTVSGGTSTIGVYVYSMAKSAYIANSRGGEVDFELAEDTELKVRIYILADTVVNGTVYPMVRLAGTDSDYSASARCSALIPIDSPLASAGNTSDKIMFSKPLNIGKIVRNTDTFTFDGNENVTLVDTDSENGMNLFKITRNDFVDAKVLCSSEYSKNGISTHFTYASNEEIVNEAVVFASGNGIYLNLPSADYSSEADVTALLSRLFVSSTPFTIVYPIAEPTEENLGNDTKNRILSMLQYEDYNRLIADENLLLDVSYKYAIGDMYTEIIDAITDLDLRISLLEL